MAKKRKRSTLRKAREAADKTVGSLVRGGLIAPERAGDCILRVGGLPQMKLRRLKPLNPQRRV